MNLQRLALASYDSDYYPCLMTQHDVDEVGYLDGDTLALFVWREMGDADGSPTEAVVMLQNAIEQLQRVQTAIVGLIQPGHTQGERKKLDDVVPVRNDFREEDKKERKLLDILEPRPIVIDGINFITGLCPVCGRKFRKSHIGFIGAKCHFEGTQFDRSGHELYALNDDYQTIRTHKEMAYLTYELYPTQAVRVVSR